MPTPDQPITPDYQRLALAGYSVRAHTSIPQTWLLEVLNQTPTTADRHYQQAPLPNTTGAAFVKTYNRRPRHTLRRRLKSGRSIHEARGYIAFANKGIPTPTLLFWGERRVMGGLLWESGVIGTGLIDAPTVADRYANTPSLELLERTAHALAHIHSVGLAHGDPRTRNFLAPETPAQAPAPEIIPFDLCSWGALTPRRRQDDLVKLLGSAVALTNGDSEIVTPMIDAYQSACRLDERLDIGTLRDSAVTYAQREGAP